MLPFESPWVFAWLWGDSMMMRCILGVVWSWTCTVRILLMYVESYTTVYVHTEDWDKVLERDGDVVHYDFILHDVWCILINPLPGSSWGQRLLAIATPSRRLLATLLSYSFLQCYDIHTGLRRKGCNHQHTLRFQDVLYAYHQYRYSKGFRQVQILVIAMPIPDTSGMTGHRWPL